MSLAGQLGRYRSTRPPFKPIPSGDLFQRKTDEIFRELPHLFGIAGNILIVDNVDNGTNYDTKLYRVLQICWKEDLKQDKDNCISDA